MLEQENIPLEGRYQGSLIGLATGDALGTTLEFKSPGTLRHSFATHLLERDIGLIRSRLDTPTPEGNIFAPKQTAKDGINVLVVWSEKPTWHLNFFFRKGIDFKFTSSTFVG